MRKIVVIPTYNERGNIESLVEAIFTLGADLHILVVDDNSPDGTGGLVKAMQSKFKSLHLLVGENKRGLAKAYLAGFRWCLENGYDVMIQMDADFSHRPADLKKIAQAIETTDVVVGSRYIPGGGTVNWGWLRRLISRGGSLYARLILGYPLCDWTGGFNAWKRSVLEKINLERISSEGYSFQIEMKYRALQNGFKVTEVPILFEERRAGQSKMSLHIVIEALYRVWGIRLG